MTFLLGFLLSLAAGVAIGLAVCSILVLVALVRRNR